MRPINFNESVLYISLRSPFARRVRLAFLESGISFEEKVFDVFKPTSELLAVNPLARVPVLKLQSGQVLIDSNFILEAFYHCAHTPLKVHTDSDLIQVFHWSALSIGICDKTIEFFLDSLRPEHQRDPDIEVELKEATTRSLILLEEELKSGGQYLVGQKLTQADLNIATALTYFNLRYPSDWESRYPHTQLYLQQLESRPSFQQTRPPRAT